MDYLQSFFHRSRIFWLFTKLIWIVSFSGAIVVILRESDLDPGIMGMLVFYTIYVLLQISGAVSGIGKYRHHPAISLVTGIFSVLLGILMLIMAITTYTGNLDALLSLFLVLLPIWLILSGVGDFFNYKHPWILNRFSS